MHKRLHPFLPFVVILFGLLAYVGSFGGTFLLDDNAHIANSSSIRNLGSYINHSSRPLAALSFHLNYLLSGSDPTDYHAVNLVIHLGAALLLYGIVRRTLQSPLLVARYGSFSYLIALFAAILWAVHPVQTGSVTYVVQRAESMMGFFYLLALYCFARGIGPGRNAAWFVCATAACGLGMGAKAVMVTAPLVLLLYDRTFFAGSAGKALRLRWPAYAGLAATWGILAFLVLRPHESAATTGLSVKGMTPLTYLATQQGVICHYLKLVVWPKDLCLDYAWPPALTVSHMLPYAVAVGVLVLLAAVLTFRRHPAGFCLAWFLIVLAPSSSIIPIADYAFEHRLYLPVAGLASLFAGSIVMLVNRLLRKRESTVRVALASSALVLAVAAALTVRTVDRNKDYASFIRITRSNVRIRPHNFRVRTMLIDALMGELDFPGAEEEAMRLVADVEKALQSRDRLYATSASNPSYYLPAAINMAGVALLCRGRNEEALPLMVRALQLRPGFEKARYNLAVTLFGLGRYDDAMKEALRSIELSSDSSKAHMLAGMILVKTGKHAEAKPYLEKAAVLDAANVIAKLELAWLLATAPDADLREGKRAAGLAEEVRRLTGGGNHRSLDVLAAAYAECGAFELAEETAQQALAIAAAVFDSGETVDIREIASTIVSTPGEIEERIRFYRNKQPWRQAPLPGLSDFGPSARVCR